MRGTTVPQTMHAPGRIADLRWPGSNADIRGLLERMQTLRTAVRAVRRTLVKNWRPRLRKREFLSSAANLATYIGLRRHDLRPIQDHLTTLGLSSLGRCEGHVMATLDAVIHALKQMTGAHIPRGRVASVARAITRDQVLLRRHTNRLVRRAVREPLDALHGDPADRSRSRLRARM